MFIFCSRIWKQTNSNIILTSQFCLLQISSSTQIDWTHCHWGKAIYLKEHITHIYESCTHWPWWPSCLWLYSKASLNNSKVNTLVVQLSSWRVELSRHAHNYHLIPPQVTFQTKSQELINQLVSGGSWGSFVHFKDPTLIVVKLGRQVAGQWLIQDCWPGSC